MLDEAVHLVLKGGRGRLQAREAEGRQPVAQHRIHEVVGRRAVVMEERLHALALIFGVRALQEDAPGGDLERPDEVLHHLLGRHAAPEGRRVRPQGVQRAEEERPQEGVAERRVVDVEHDLHPCRSGVGHTSAFYHRRLGFEK